MKKGANFFNIVVWSKLAEVCGKYLVKGRPVHIEGRLQNQSWEDKHTGQKRTATEIVADGVQFIGGRDEQEPSQASAREHAEPAQASFDTEEVPF